MLQSNQSSDRDKAAADGFSTRVALAKRLLFWTILLVFLISPIGAAEVFLRFGVGLGHPILYRTNTSYRYAPAPNQHVTRRRGAEVTIDSVGLRDVREWTSRADQRLLFVGDSVTWAGTSVDDREMFATLVCDRMSALLRRDMLCGNAGVNGYGVDNMVYRLRYDPVVRQANVIVVTLISDDTLRGLMDLGRLPFYSREPHGPLRAIWEATGILGLAAVDRLMHPAVSDRGPVSAEELRVSSESLTHLVETLRAEQASGRKVLIVFSPTAMELKQSQRATITQNVRQIIAASRLPYLDLTETVEANDGADFFIDGVHLDRRGHRVYAKAIAEKLVTFYRNGDSG